MATLQNLQRRKIEATGQRKFEDLPESLKQGLKTPIHPRDFNKITTTKSYEDNYKEQRQKLQEELASNPKAGPRPISIEEYRKRQKHQVSRREQQTTTTKK